jgi:hypothetical protein
VAVRELLKLIRSFPDHFDETSMFMGGQHAQVAYCRPQISVLTIYKIK